MPSLTETPEQKAERLIVEAVSLQLDYEVRLLRSARILVSDAETELLRFAHSPEGKIALPSGEMERRMIETKARIKAEREVSHGRGEKARANEVDGESPGGP